ncbi:MAG TPA: PAS domain-containing protein, partial [Thermodesulfobacteriota bacterium]|nr:PAS domain-containing protein [Thermodesulfobacteriota bacterium]
MKVKDKTKKQLLEEMEVLHKQLVKLKKAETERKRAEEALKERQETINAIIETSQDWIWAIDRHGVHTYSNPAIERILGYGTEQIVGRSSLDLLHEDDKKMVEPILRECE